jgi:Protein of unknown function (DUF3568)
MINKLVAGIVLVSCIWLQACTEVVVPGTITGAGEVYRYATNVAQKTYMGDVRQVNAAARNALKKMQIRLDSMDPGDSATQLTASTMALDITINLIPITAATTKVTVDAVKEHVIRDKATADAILSQIQTELDRSRFPDKAFPKVFVKNECHRPIDVIVYYLSGKDESEIWQTRGWFSLEPGQKKHVADTRNRYIYFYGETRSDDKITWTGDLLQWFEGRSYGFFKVDMGTALKDYTHPFSCN